MLLYVDDRMQPSKNWCILTWVFVESDSTAAISRRPLLVLVGLCDKLSGIGTVSNSLSVVALNIRSLGGQTCSLTIFPESTIHNLLSSLSWEKSEYYMPVKMFNICSLHDSYRHSRKQCWCPSIPSSQFSCANSSLGRVPTEIHRRRRVKKSSTE